MLPKGARFIFLISTLIIFIPLDATLIGVLDLPSLTSRADIVAIGEVISVVDRGPTTLDLGGGPLQATHFVAALQVDQSLKGAVQGETETLDFAVPQMPVGVQGVARCQYGLFFLSHDQGVLRFTDPMHPSLPATRNAEVRAASVLDQVTAVLGQVLESPEVSDSDRFMALDALGRLKTVLAKDTLHHSLGSSSRTIRLDVARTLVARDDLSGLGIVEDALLHPSGLSETMFLNLAGSLAGLKDPRSIPVLRRLIETNDQHIIKSAAIALRQSGSADALEPLSRVLNNGDEYVRYYAVVGMGEITRQDEWTPTFPEFHDHEGKYLSYWRDWAASNLPRDISK